MRVVFVGTGVTIFSKKRCAPCLIIEFDGDMLVFDCGPGSMRNATLLGYETKDFKYIFITHLHLDHIADLIPLLKERWLTTQKELIVFGPPGLKKFVNLQIEDVYLYLKGCHGIVKVNEKRSGFVTRITSLSVTCTPTKHADGVAYRIDTNRKSILYSGDTTYDENLAEFGKSVDLAILECSFPSREELKGFHMSPEDVGILASKMKAKKVALVHLYPECDGKEEEMIRKVKDYFDGEVIIPNDGDVIEL